MMMCAVCLQNTAAAAANDNDDDDDDDDNAVDPQASQKSANSHPLGKSAFFRLYLLT